MAQQINLFNPVYLKQKKYFSAVTMLQALGLLLGGVLAFYGFALLQSQARSREAADAARQLAARSAQVASLTREFSPQGRSRALQEEVARTAARLKQRQELMAALHAGGLGNTTGFARYLTAFARQPLGGVWLTGISISADEIALVLSGRVLQADLVPAYLRALNREEVMRGRRVSELRLTAKEEREPATAAPGATPGATGAKPPAAPSRYVEFSLIALRQVGSGAKETR